MTPELARARDAVAAHERTLERLTARRDAAIRKAARRHSLQEISDACGLSKPRIHQIVGPRS